MSNVLDFTKKRDALLRSQRDQQALEVFARAVMDKRFSREDLEVLCVILRERPADGSLSAYLSSQKIAKSCAKFVAFGLLESDGPYECFDPDGDSVGWFQCFEVR